MTGRDASGGLTTCGDPLEFFGQSYAGREAITEVEFLCFYDTVSWPAVQRNQLQPPTGCAG